MIRIQHWQALGYTHPDEQIEIARVAEEVGFAGLLLSDHLFVPIERKSKYPYSASGNPDFGSEAPFPDAFLTMAVLAQHTTRLRFATNVYILPLRHPVEVAKSLGTAAVHSKNRVVLGVGAGWMKDEFDVLGEPPRPAFRDSDRRYRPRSAKALQKHCRSPAHQIHVCSPPGALVHAGEPLAWLEGGAPTDDEPVEFVDAFVIASRALPPAMNDPGTAIDIIGRATRVLFVAAESRTVRREARCPSVRMPDLMPDDLFDDAFLPIAHDGAGLIEVQLRLQKALEALARTDDAPFREAALSLSRHALDYGLGALSSEVERQRLSQAAQRVGTR